MFIKTSIFKRILKDAWKGAGLTVGKKEEMYFIQGAYWILFVYEKDFTSKNKAAVIELVGDLPEEGEVYRAYEKGEKQYELKVRDETGPMGMGYFVLWVNETGMLLTVKTPADEESNGGKILKALAGLEME